MTEKREVTETQLARIKDYWEIFETDAGIRVLEDMRKEYCNLPYTLGDSHDTCRKVGNMEVILDIERMMKFREMPIEVIKEEEAED